MTGSPIDLTLIRYILHLARTFTVLQMTFMDLYTLRLIFDYLLFLCKRNFHGHRCAAKAVSCFMLKLLRSTRSFKAATNSISIPHRSASLQFRFMATTSDSPQAKRQKVDQPKVGSCLTSPYN